MNELFPVRPATPDQDTGLPVQVDPTHDSETRRRWEARAAQWRARELAEELFGGEVRASLSASGTRGAFRGLLHLEVPFSDLTTHRARESRFLSCAAQDALLSGVPLVVVFSAASR